MVGLVWFDGIGLLFGGETGTGTVSVGHIIPECFGGPANPGPAGMSEKLPGVDHQALHAEIGVAFEEAFEAYRNCPWNRSKADWPRVFSVIIQVQGKGRGAS
jgi:hypothetical protein